jgi:Tfp pilus assembly protein PilN
MLEMKSRFFGEGKNLTEMKVIKETLDLLTRIFISDSSFGIDFRKRYLILTLLKKSLGKIVLADYRIHPISPEGQKEEREIEMIGLINAFISKNQINKEKVSVAIPRDKVVARFIRLPVATKENLRKVMEYEASRYTPFENGEFYSDYHILGEEKEWLHLFVLFVKKAEVDHYLALLKKIGIQPVSVQIPSTAALNLFFYNEGAKENETSVLLNVTEPFFEMDLLNGKEWKESFHLPLPRDERASRVINTFKHSSQNVHSHSKSTFFVYGLDADETMLTDLEADHVQRVLVPPLNRIDTAREISKPYKIYPSIGIPLKELVTTRFNLNLLPFEMRKRVRQIGKPLVVTLASIALALTLTWGAGAIVRYRSQLNSVNKEIRRGKPEVEAIMKLQKQKDECRKEISELERIRAGEVSKTEVLEELTKILPDTVWIWNFRYSRKEIEISGFADSASNLISLIDKSPVFEKVEFLAPVTKERLMRGSETREHERFKIKARIEGR